MLNVEDVMGNLFYPGFFLLKYYSCSYFTVFLVNTVLSSIAF